MWLHLIYLILFSFMQTCKNAQASIPSLWFPEWQILSLFFSTLYIRNRVLSKSLIKLVTIKMVSFSILALWELRYNLPIFLRRVAHGWDFPCPSCFSWRPQGICSFLKPILLSKTKLKWNWCSFKEERRHGGMTEMMGTELVFFEIKDGLNRTTSVVQMIRNLISTWMVQLKRLWSAPEAYTSLATGQDAHWRFHTNSSETSRVSLVEFVFTGA